MSDGTTLYPPWKQAVKRLLDDGLDFGSVVTRLDIAKLCDIAPPRNIDDVRRYDLELLRNISEIRDTLLTAHCMLLVANGEGGFIVIHPKDQTSHSIKTGVKAITKEMQRMATSVNFVRTDLLDNEQRAQNADAIAKVSSLAGMLSKHEILKINERATV